LKRSRTGWTSPERSCVEQGRRGKIKGREPVARGAQEAPRKKKWSEKKGNRSRRAELTDSSGENHVWEWRKERGGAKIWQRAGGDLERGWLTHTKRTKSL